MNKSQRRKKNNKNRVKVKVLTYLNWQTWGRRWAFNPPPSPRHPSIHQRGSVLRVFIKLFLATRRRKISEQGSEVPLGIKLNSEEALVAQNWGRTLNRMCKSACYEQTSFSPSSVFKSCISPHPSVQSRDLRGRSYLTMRFKITFTVQSLIESVRRWVETAVSRKH